MIQNSKQLITFVIQSPNLAPNNFQERLSGASRMQENLLAAGLHPWPRWGNL